MKNKFYKNRIINEEVISAKLDSGLDVLLIPKKGYIKKYAIFSTKYGSNDNKFIPINENDVIQVPEGIAHFLEHKLFEEPEGNIFDEFSKLGTNVNAFTNFNQTSYLFSCTDNFCESLELLIKFVQNPYFTDENVEKEKGIIAQEIKMYEDNPGWRVFFNALKGMYFEHPVKIDIAGTIESIQNIDKETLYKCYNTFYNPKNMVLVTVGDISFDNVIEVVNKVERKGLESEEKIIRLFPEEKKGVLEKYVEESLITSMPLLAIGFKEEDLGYDGESLVKRELVTNILIDMLFGESSEFYQKLYNEGLIDGSFGGNYSGYKDYGHSIISGQTNKPEVVADKIISHIKNRKTSGLSKEDFIRIKKKSVGLNLMGFNSIEYIGNNFVNYYFLDFSFLDYLDICEKISYEDILNRLQTHFIEGNYVLSVVKQI